MACPGNGAVYVFAGSSTLSGSRAASGADVTIAGNDERFGFAVGGGLMLGGISGDFNNDGTDDLIWGLQRNR